MTMPSAPHLSRHEIAEIAHELRSPLGGFEAMLDLLARTPLSVEQQRLVEALEASAMHLRAVLARVLPPHQGEELSSPTLGPLLGAIAASAAARAAARALRFECQLDDTLDRGAEIEAIPLRQVLENLIDNAIRMTASGAVRLSVSMAGHGRIAFSLTDDGPGLDPAQAERLMMPGGKGDGNGLGLPIAARLVVQRGGKLLAEKRPEGGTTFRFDWPDRPDAGDQAAARLLIVDDHPASRLVLRTILGALGFEVEEAADVESARSCLTRGTFAAVLTDLHMPDGGGATILREIAALPAASRPAAIVVSADDPREDATLAPMVSQVVTKPLAMPALIAALRGVGLQPRPARAA
jgi:CheY-like chemotaxis protein/two-component sensor histidine kinase